MFTPDVLGVRFESNFCVETHMMFQSIHPRSLTVRPSKIDAWKMILSFWGPAYFQGRTVKLPGRIGWCFTTNETPTHPTEVWRPRRGGIGSSGGWIFFFLNGEIWATGMFFLFIRESLKNHRNLVDCKVLGLKFANDRMFSHG